MVKKPSERYVYDGIIGSAITLILNQEQEITGYQLRKQINDMVYDMKERKRKRREKEETTGYVPSRSKISATIKKLLEWNWLQTDESYTQALQRKKVNGSIKVKYHLSERAKNIDAMGLNPDEAYMVDDMYQMILRTATMGIWTNPQKGVWGYPQLFKCKVISGTTVEDIYLKKDCLIYANFNHQPYLREDVEKIFQKIFDEGIIKKDLIDKTERYIIDQRLKEFIEFSWMRLFHRTLDLVKHIFFKGFSKRNPNYKSILKWLNTNCDKEHVQTEFIQTWFSEKEGYRKYKKELPQYIKFASNRISIYKKQAEEIFRRNNDLESFEKFKKVRNAVINYVCPDYLLKAISNI